jgi:hypothetical protein
MGIFQTFVELVGVSTSCVTNKHATCGIIEAPSQKVIMLTTLQEYYLSCATLYIGKLLENPQN